MKTESNVKTTRLVQIALLVAIILILAFTPLGYIKTLGLEITLIVIPVTIGAILLGPVGGAILGGVFGITSFIQCFGMSAFGATLLSINPWATLIGTIIPRILMGWLTGLLFAGLRKTNMNKNVAIALANLGGPIFNTIFFMSGLVLFFYKTDYIQGFVDYLGTNSVLSFVIAFVGINGLVEAVACFIIGTAITKALDVYQEKSKKI
ncbi:MAG TPA: ECF transporter S component [Clostridiales bacterium]|nr:ECF transporter S component [Clostridiales bacterium]